MTPWTAAHQASLSFIISHSLLKFISIESVMLSDSSSVTPFYFCLQPFPTSGSFPSSWLFASGGQCIGASDSASHPSSECLGLIFFRIDWFDLAVQGTLKSLFQHHSLKASFLQRSAFFMVQLSHPSMTPGKMIAWTDYMDLYGKVMSLFFNKVFRFFFL